MAKEGLRNGSRNKGKGWIDCKTEAGGRKSAGWI